jgi:hypothetical protein
VKNPVFRKALQQLDNSDRLRLRRQALAGQMIAGIFRRAGTGDFPRADKPGQMRRCLLAAETDVPGNIRRGSPGVPVMYARILASNGIGIN